MGPKTSITDREREQIAGVKVNRAAQRRRDAAERAAAIAALGMAPEDGTADGRYVATTGELVRDARAAGKLA